MARKDILASGARSAKFIGGVGEDNFDRNLSKEPRMKMPKMVKVKKVTKTFVPFGDVVHIRSVEETLGTGILVTDTIEKDRPLEGVVLAVGEAVTGITKGMLVAFGKYSGAEFKINGETTLLMRSEEILGQIR